MLPLAPFSVEHLVDLLAVLLPQQLPVQLPCLPQFSSVEREAGWLYLPVSDEVGSPVSH